MENYRISVALATYNGASFLNDQLQSIFNQTLKPFEIIVCDDRSTDQTHTILQAYQDKGLLKFQINDTSLGVIKNFQKTISFCRGEYIALSDQDDIWMPEKLEQCIKEMKKIEKNNTKPALVFSDLEVVDENLNVISSSLWQHLRAKPWKETFSSILFGNVVTGCAMVINQPMADALKNIPPQAMMHDHWAALIAFGFGQYGFITDRLVKYRQHTLNVTNNYKRNLKNRIATLFKDVRQSFKNNGFLEKELNQAAAFEGLFKTQLPEGHQQMLSKFLILKKAGFLKRKYRSFLSNNLSN
jgi:glycosyltransferase involved in cell wall biosynthesis